jgi:hypothetical protein
MLLTLAAATQAQQDQAGLLGTSEVKKGTWTGQLTCYSLFRTIGAAAASPAKAQETLECVKKAGALDWLGILMDEEGFAKIVGDKAAKNYESLYPFIGKRVQVTGTLALPNQYSRGLPPGLIIDKITVAK